MSEPAGGLALVRVPVAPVHGEPRVSSAQVTQTLFGRVVWWSGRAGDWYRVRTTPDGYEGWAHAGYLLVVDAPEAAELRELQAAADAFDAEAPGTVGVDLRAGGQRMSLGCVARVGGRTLRLPLGAWLGPDAVLLEGEAVPMGELPARFRPDGAAVVRTAARYFASTSYQWGGVTPWGADCSGFVQAVLALHGVDLPRDASQQVAGGRDAGADLAAHQAGDLLFFSERDDGRVTHVGLAAGAGRMLHVALGRGGFADDDLAAGDDAYVAALRGRFVGARRVLGPG